jgi:hypothetical protein
MPCPSYGYAEAGKAEEKTVFFDAVETFIQDGTPNSRERVGAAPASSNLRVGDGESDVHPGNGRNS